MSAFLLTLVPDHSLLLSTHQIMFWFIMAGIAVSGKETGGFGTGSDPDQKSGKKLQGAFVIFLIIMAAGYYHKLHAVEPGPYGYGYYKPERRDGELMRWTMNQSCIEVSAESDYFGFSLYAEPEHFEKGAVHVDLFMDDVLIDTVLLDEKGFAHKYYYMPGIHGRVVRFKLAADSTYNPYKLGVTDNIRHSREQSVAVTDVHFFQIPLKEAKEVKP